MPAIALSPEKPLEPITLEKRGVESPSSVLDFGEETMKAVEIADLPAPEDEAEGDDEGEKVTEVMFQDIAEHCTRRTAASVFFETLQLKTWDFIEIDQDEDYGPITIMPGTRFGEAPPKAGS